MGEMKRKEAYLWLADELNIEPEECHIGMFDIPTCEKAIRILIKTTPSPRQ
jgi:predicted nuclease of restriction endonuclease-like RecB superfamily